MAFPGSNAVAFLDDSNTDGSVADLLECYFIAGCRHTDSPVGSLFSAVVAIYPAPRLPAKWLDLGVCCSWAVVPFLGGINFIATILKLRRRARGAEDDANWPMYCWACWHPVSLWFFRQIW